MFAVRRLLFFSSNRPLSLSSFSLLLDSFKESCGKISEISFRVGLEISDDLSLSLSVSVSVSVFVSVPRLRIHRFRPRISEGATSLWKVWRFGESRFLIPATSLDGKLPIRRWGEAGGNSAG